MNKKRIYIILAIMLSTFLGVMIFIGVKNYKNPVNLEETTIEHNYAQNPVKERPDLTEEEIAKAGIIEVDGATYSGLENITYEQMADRTRLITILNNSCKSNSNYGQIVSAKVDPELSNKDIVYIDVNFDNNMSDTYVVLFDTYNLHQFTRCVSKYDWELISTGQNM